jgi:dTDP-4-dehydrorhamnose 3,5-epimerase
MTFLPMKIEGAWAHEPNIFSDARGTFQEQFKLSEIRAKLGRSFGVHQVNQSVSAAGVIRGIHWTDSVAGQAKYVSCSRGLLWDVVVDLRPTSPTYGQWDARYLSPENGVSLLISEGIGHAFLALEDGTVATYLCTSEFEPASDRSVNPLSRNLAIPFSSIAAEHGISDLTLSDKDRTAADFS